MSLRPDGRAVSFFGDLHPSFAGNVVKAMSSAKQGYPVVTRALRGVTPVRPHPPASCSAKLDDELARHRARGGAADADHRRGGGAGRRWPPAPSSPASSTACRTSRPWRRPPTARASPWRAWRSPGAWTDKDAGPALDHRAGDGRLVRPLRPAAARRAGDPDGPDRPRHRDPRGRDRAADRRRPRQRGAVLDRPGDARQGQPRRSTSPATRRRSTATRSGEIERAADTIVWCCDEAPGFAPDRPQRPRLRRQHRRGAWTPMARARWASSADPAEATSTASSPSARTA